MTRDTSWRLDARAPRWALHQGYGTLSAAGLFLVAVILAAIGAFLAAHFIDRFLPASASGPSGAPLALLVGAWSVVVLIFGAAILAGIFAFRSNELHLRMSGHPSAAAEAQLAAQMREETLNAVLRLTEQGGGAAIAGVASKLDKLLNQAPTQPALPAGGQIGGGSSFVNDSSSVSNPSGTAHLVDPATTLSPKVVAGAATAAASAAFWIVAAATFWHKLEPTILTALGTGVTAVTSAIAGWWKTDPLRIKQVTESHPT